MVKLNLAETVNRYHSPNDVYIVSKTAQNPLEQAVRAHKAAKFDDCVEICRAFLDTNPDHTDALQLLGLGYHAKGRFQDAIQNIERALALAPNNPLYHANLATVFNDAGKLSLAEQHYLAATKQDPNNAAAFNGLGVIARKQLNYNVAIEQYRRALALDNDFTTAHNNLANVLTLSGQAALALEHAENALRLDESAAEAWNNLGFAQTMLGEFKQAEDAFQKALALDPHLAVANFNLSANYLRSGDYAKGWEAYEWRLRLNGQNPNLDPGELKYPLPDSLQGKSLGLIAEQGMGDFLQFLRFTKPLYELGAKLCISCDKRLISLVENLPWFEQIVPRGEKLPACDFTMPMMSVARMLSVSYEDVRNDIPYLRVPIAETDKWAKRLSSAGDYLVGMTWHGNPDNPVNQLRSIPLAQFEKLAGISGVQLISLQTGVAVNELLDRRDRLAPLDLDVFDRQESLTFEFTDTAALLLNVDLFITSCTVTAHLAGALGVPTWLVVSHVADWRWGHDEEYSRWYPSIRIFRQTSPGDWGEVFNRVQQNLSALVIKTRETYIKLG
ncbi:MAG: tetratricopeptide repeat protein [Pseudomonadota bacterium]